MLTSGINNDFLILLPLIDLSEDDNIGSYFKFVKRIIKNNSSKYGNSCFKEIEAAYS